MNETSNILAFRQPSTVDDPLTDILRAGARDLLARAIAIEVDAFLASTADLRCPTGERAWSDMGTVRCARLRPGSVP